MAERITRDEVRHVAGLARLRFTEAELDELTGQLAAVLDHAADVAALDVTDDVTDVAPTAHPPALTDVTRSDEIRPSLDRDEVLAQAPVRQDGQFRVPSILGEAP